MSDTTKLILAIVVAVIVVAVIMSVVLNARKRRETEHRRFEAGELRAKIEQQAPVLRENDDRASVTSEIAASARSEADVAAEAAELKAQEARALEEQATKKDEEARRLEKHAEGHASAAEDARSSAAALALEADRLDPDVRTDDEGHRLDAADPASQESTAEESPAAPFLRDDDEPDLADAENPFASTSHEPATSVSEEGMGTKESSDRPTDESRDDVSNDDTTAPDTTTPDTSADTSGNGSSNRTPDTATSESSWQGSSATGAAAAAGAGAAAGWASRGDEDDSETDASPDATDLPSESARETADTADAADTADTDNESDRSHSAEPADERTSGSVSGSPDDEQRVSVPALDDRDEVVTGSGTPADDPGDHRGQPWATTTGEQPPAADTEEGADTHSEPSDGGQQAVGSSGSGEYASDQTAADDFSSSTGSSTGPDDTAQHDHSDHEGHDHSDHEGQDDGQGSQGSAGRRISNLDEVRDGGYGVGSAAPFGDGAQPLGHEIKASRDGGTFLAPDDEGYADHDPDVWFYDEESARRAGFHKDGE